MNVLITFLSFAEDTFGGIENSILNLAKGLQICGSNVAVYTSYMGGSGESVYGVEAIRSHLLLPDRLPRANRERDDVIRAHLSLNRRSISSELREIVQRRSVDVIIACDLLWGIVPVICPWEDFSCTVVSSLHVLNDQNSLTAAHRQPYLFHRCVSEFLREQISERARFSELEVIPNSIDLSLYGSGQNVGRASNVIFCNSRIDPGKGIGDLLAGFAAFRESHPSFELWLCAGESPFGDRSDELPIVDSAINSLGLASAVRMLPNLKWTDIPRLVEQAFAIVLPTYYESFGRAALEALASGVPLVATTVGNLPNLIGEAGILIPPKSPSEINAALKALQKRPDLYEDLRARGPLQARPYENAVVGRAMLSAIERRRRG